MRLMTSQLAGVLCGILATTYGGTYDDRRRLQHELKKKMDSGIRPIQNQSDVLNVGVRPSLIQVQGIKQDAQLFFSTFVLQFTWMMDTLRWDPSKFGGINMVHLSTKEAWFPDIVYQNTINNLFDIKNGDRMRITVVANGSSTWTTGGNLVSHCRIDITDYPFDEQVCHVTIGKMFSYDYEMMIIPSSDVLQLNKYKENDEWILTGTRVRYVKIKDQLHFVELEVSIKRRPLYYLLSVILPLTMLSLMNVFSFKLAISSGERIAYCISMLLTFCVFLSNVADSIPRVSQSVSYLHLYASIQLTVGMVTTIMSIFLVNFATQENSKDIPRWIEMLYNCTCHKTVTRIDVEPCTDHNPAQDAANNGKEEYLGVPVLKTRHDRSEVARFIDHISFCLFLCLFLISTLTLFLIMIF